MGINGIDDQSENDIYKKYPFLMEYKEEFTNTSGEINIEKIIGEGNYGVILDGPPERVYKLGRSREYSELLYSEYRKHIAFYLAFKKIEANFPNFRIPETSIDPKKINGAISGDELYIYEMEKIQGHNLLSYLIKEELSKIGLILDLTEYSDIEIENLYTKHTGKGINLLRNGKLLNLSNDQNKFIKSIKRGQILGVGDPFPSLLFHKYFPKLYIQISGALNELKKKGYKHLDLHAKNIMISHSNDDNPIIYIIDFGIVETPNINF